MSMRQVILTAILVLASTIGYAQGVLEPEYNGQVAVVNADSTTTLLQREITKMKVKSSGLGYLPVPGAGLLDKTKSYMSVKGQSSPMKVQGNQLTLLIRVKDHNEDPKDAFGIFRFQIKKKDRRYELASVGALSGMKATTTFTTVPYKVRKYGKSSYLVSLENLEPGEYGVTTGDLGNVATFSVKE